MNTIEEDMKTVRHIARTHYKLPRGITVEDIESAGYLGIVMAQQKFDSTKGPWKPFLIWRIKDCIRTYLKYWQNQTFGLSQDNDLNLEEDIDAFEIVADQPHIDHDLCIKDDISLLKRLMSKLPEKQKDAVDKYYFQELMIKDIAKLKKCSINAVDQLLRHARKHLKKLYYELRPEEYSDTKRKPSVDFILAQQYEENRRRYWRNNL